MATITTSDPSGLPLQDIERFAKMIDDRPNDPDEIRRVITLAMLRGADIGRESPTAETARNVAAMDRSPRSVAPRQRAELERKLGITTKRARHV